MIERQVFLKSLIINVKYVILIVCPLFIFAIVFAHVLIVK